MYLHGWLDYKLQPADTRIISGYKKLFGQLEDNIYLQKTKTKAKKA